MIRLCRRADLPDVYDIINDAARAYKEVIPADRWHEPYMPMEELVSEIASGVVFWGWEGPDSRLVGVMGIQDRGEVHLIRHAYVRTSHRRKGVGAKLLRHLESQTRKPILIGTWGAADWAVRFYQKHGYQIVPAAEKDLLLRRYWRIPERQVETSVVLGNSGWLTSTLRRAIVS